MAWMTATVLVSIFKPSVEKIAYVILWQVKTNLLKKYLDSFFMKPGTNIFKLFWSILFFKNKLRKVEVGGLKADVINKFQHSMTSKLHWNNLAVPTHVISFHQSEYIFSAKRCYATVELVIDVSSFAIGGLFL